MMVPSTAYNCDECGNTQFSSGGLFYALPFTGPRRCFECGSTELSVDESYPLY